MQWAKRVPPSALTPKIKGIGATAIEGGLLNRLENYGNCWAAGSAG